MKMSTAGAVVHRRLCSAGSECLMLALSRPSIGLCHRGSRPVAGSGWRSRFGLGSGRRGMSTGAWRDLLRVSDEVAEAIRLEKPVVALEFTIYTHGSIGKDLAQEHQDLVRHRGGIPAIVAIVDGVPSVGVSARDITRMMEDKDTVKASRRDIPYLVGMGLAGRKIHGGTTISGTMALARLAGIRVFGTGGLGGVHRGGELSLDVSADLTELGRTRVAVVCSGCKGFLDIPRTLEYLETQGCLVSTFAQGRTGTIDFPAFWARDSGTASPSVVYSEREAAAMILVQERLGIESGLLFANPIPEESAIPSEEMRTAIEQAVQEAVEKGFTGNRNTPFVLRRLRQLVGERVVVANKALAAANIGRATDIAVELSRLLPSPPETKLATSSTKTWCVTCREPAQPSASADSKADILVAGAAAVDLSCDYNCTTKPVRIAPRSHTSNPARISQSIGGVGHNVALAAHRTSQQARVRLCSMVGDDLAGSTVLSSLEASGLDTTYVRQLNRHSHPHSRTAQHVAVNDGNGNLVVAMADMGIFTQQSYPREWGAAVAATAPKWLVVDGNWSSQGIRTWIKAGREHGAQVAFEPVSVEKSQRLFCPQTSIPKLSVFPHASVHLATPNEHELASMYAAARDIGYLELGAWFDIIDAFGMRGARDRFVALTSAELTDAGVPVQSVQLLPYIPTLLTKLGSRGVLLTSLLGRDDALLRDGDASEFILTRAAADHPCVGGIYMRLFPPADHVEDVVSVNGAGDSFLGVLVSGLAQGRRVENLVDVAQCGAVQSLRCRESVSPDLGQLQEQMTRVISRGLRRV